MIINSAFETMCLSVIIPTYNRPDDLPRLFASIADQREAADEVLVVVGPGDNTSFEIAASWKQQLPSLHIIQASKASVVHALNLGLSHARGEIICLLDDDVWLPPSWSATIRTAFRTDPKLGAFGGRDHLQNGDLSITDPPLARHVGTFHWNGHKGYHHCGAVKSPAKVDVIKGVNLSFRRIAFPAMQIDTALEGKGAETCWEIDICQRILVVGYHNVYDNQNYVLHYWSPRLGFDNRTEVFAPAWPQRIYNEAYVFAKFRPVTERIVWALRLFLVGARNQPGLLWAALLLKKAGPRVLQLPFRNVRFVCQGFKLGRRNRPLPAGGCS